MPEHHEGSLNLSGEGGEPELPAEPRSLTETSPEGDTVTLTAMTGDGSADGRYTVTVTQVDPKPWSMGVGTPEEPLTDFAHAFTNGRDADDAKVIFWVSSTVNRLAVRLDSGWTAVFEPAPTEH